jgi:8-oxo-dGTP pyrophosphatase MutT (NUDIX family)
MTALPDANRFSYQNFESTSLKAGVLVLLYPRDGVPHLVFVRRTSTVEHHKNQVSFPGGQVEAGEDFERAALREAEEEIGVSPERIRIIGRLTPLYVPPSNYCIYPVVGVLDGAPAFVADPAEVEEVIEVPLANLLDPGSIQSERHEILGQTRDVPYYALDRHKIWGATAMVLAEFLDILSRI